jgi:hypothetical protein
MRAFGSGLLAVLLAACVADNRPRGDTVPSALAVANGKSERCRDGSPQQVADTWLLQRLRSGATLVESDTIHIFEADSSRRADSTARLGDAYGAYFRPFYGDDAAAIVPRFRWQETSAVEAFVITVPSEMYGTATAVWTYDFGTCSWGHPTMTSDHGADGGDEYRLDTWVVDLNGDGRRDLVQRAKTWGEGPQGPFSNDKLSTYYWQGVGNYFGKTAGADERLKKAFDFQIR